jgi:hypothetical protein
VVLVVVVRVVVVVVVPPPPPPEPTGKDPERTWAIQALLALGYCHVIAPAPKEETVIKRTGKYERKPYSILGPLPGPSRRKVSRDP